MDKLTTYGELIRNTLTRYAELINGNPTPGVEAELVFDEEHGSYLLLNVGWSGRGRVRGITLHVRLRDGKIWIEEDWTEHGIASDLIEGGVRKEDIVLTFQHPQMRPFTEFAIA